MSSRFSSPQSLRCFVGIDFHVPRGVRSLLDDLGGLGRAVRAVPAENLHITLKFLGDVEVDAIRSVDQAVVDACHGESNFEFDLVGTGVFPDERRPTVAWIGIERAEPLARLVRRLEEGFEPLGFPRESREFRPHLTVARIKAKPPERMFDVLSTNADKKWGTISVDRVVLFESTLERRGAVYSKIATHPLGE